MEKHNNQFRGPKKKVRLIDANAHIERICKDCGGGCNFDEGCCILVDELMNAPTVDAVEVVRCCSCEKHDHDGATGYCNRWEKWTKMSDFCSYGERRTVNG